jgi:predicted dehydrogenase
MRDKVGIGIIGTGVGLRTHLPAFKELANAKVIALAGRNLDRARALAAQHEIADALPFEVLCAHPDIDLVCVTSPNPFHLDHVMAALRGGKHVLCEKPLAMDAAAIQLLIDAARARPDQLALVNYQLRFNPYLRKMKQVIEDGQLGRPYFLRIHQQSIGFSDLNAAWSWSFDAKQGGGVRLAMGSHLVDLVVYWFGDRINSVRGAMHPVITTRKNDLGTDVSVKASGFFSADLEFMSGLNVQLSATAAAFSQPRFDLSIYGDAGELHFNLGNKLTAAFASHRGKLVDVCVDNVRKEERENRVSIFSGSFPYFASEIVSAIKTNCFDSLAPAARFVDSLITHSLLDAIARSANVGRSQDLIERKSFSSYV